MKWHCPKVYAPTSLSAGPPAIFLLYVAATAKRGNGVKKLHNKYSQPASQAVCVLCCRCVVWHCGDLRIHLTPLASYHAYYRHGAVESEVWWSSKTTTTAAAATAAAAAESQPERGRVQVGDGLQRRAARELALHTRELRRQGCRLQALLRGVQVLSKAGKQAPTRGQRETVPLVVLDAATEAEGGRR